MTAEAAQRLRGLGGFTRNSSKAPLPSEHSVRTLSCQQHPANADVCNFPDDAIAAFLVDRTARRLSSRTVEYYDEEELSLLQAHLATQGIRDVPAITPTVLRTYLLHLRQGHTAGGVCTIFGAVRASLRWWEGEV